MRFGFVHCFCMVLLAGVLWAPVAMAKTFTLNYPPGAFTPENNTNAVHISLSEIYVESGGVSTRLYAPVNLPDRAVITGLQSWVTDKSASNLVYVRLFRVDKYGTNSAIIADAGSTALAAAGKMTFTDTADPDYATVDNSQYTYSLFVFLPPDTGATLLFHSAQITFESSPGAVVIPMN